MEKQNNKNRISYLPDTVCNIEDEFGVHTKIAEALEKKIEYADVSQNSLTIGLFGEWGTGKSVIVEKLHERIEHHTNIAFVNIDIWKYNGIPLLRHVLYEIAKQGPNSSFKKQERDKLLANLTYTLEVGNSVGKYQNSTYKKIEKWLPKVKWFSLAVAFISIACNIFPATSNLFSSIMAQISIPSFLIALSGELVNKGIIDSFKKWLGDVSENIQVMDKAIVPTISPEQFEAEFDNLLSMLAQKGISKYVIVFDNIDRCKGDFAYDVLSTIKTYMSKSNCIYIIPCDDVAIKHYLTKEYSHYDQNRTFHRDFASEFLDKLFTTYFRVPLTNELARDKFIEKCLAKTVFREIPQKSKLVQILYYAYKGETPRQIKKYINDLISYYEIAQKVDEKQEFLLDDIVVFAVMVAIKQIAPDFEKRLIDDPDLIWQISRLDTKALSNEEVKIQNLFDKAQFDFPKSKSIRSYIFFEKSSIETELSEKMRNRITFDLADDNILLATKILETDQYKDSFLQNDFYSIFSSILQFGVSNYFAQREQNKNFEVLNRSLKEITSKSSEYRQIYQCLSTLKVDDSESVVNSLVLFKEFISDPIEKKHLFDNFASLPNFNIVYDACFSIDGLDFSEAIAANIKSFSDQMQTLSPQYLSLFKTIDKYKQYQYFNADLVEKISPLITYNNLEWRKWEKDIIINCDVGLHIPKIINLATRISEIIQVQGLAVSSNVENIFELLEYLASFSEFTIEELKRNSDSLLNNSIIKSYFSSYFIMLDNLLAHAEKLFILGVKLYGITFLEQNFNANVPLYANRINLLEKVCDDCDLLELVVSSDIVFNSIISEPEMLTVILEKTNQAWKVQKVDRFISAPINVSVAKEYYKSDAWNNYKDAILSKLVSQSIISVDKFNHTKNLTENSVLQIIDFVFDILEKENYGYNLLDKGEPVFKEIINQEYSCAINLFKTFKAYNYRVDFYLELLLRRIFEDYPKTTSEIPGWEDLAKEIEDDSRNIPQEVLVELSNACIIVANQSSVVYIGLTALARLSQNNARIIYNYSEQMDLLKEKGIHVGMIDSLVSKLSDSLLSV